MSQSVVNCVIELKFRTECQIIYTGKCLFCRSIVHLTTHLRSHMRMSCDLLLWSILSAHGIRHPRMSHVGCRCRAMVCCTIRHAMPPSRVCGQGHGTRQQQGRPALCQAAQAVRPTRAGSHIQSTTDTTRSGGRQFVEHCWCISDTTVAGMLLVTLRRRGVELCSTGTGDTLHVNSWRRLDLRVGSGHATMDSA